MQLINAYIKKVPFYILLAGLYPVFFLWFTNYYQVGGYVILRSLAISTTFAIVIFLLFAISFRSIRKGSLVSIIFLLLFFSYGHVYSLIESESLFGFIIGRHRYIIPLFVLSGIAACLFVFRKRLFTDEMTWWLNIFSGILFGLILIQIGISAISIPKSETAAGYPSGGINGNDQPGGTTAVTSHKTDSSLKEPDIYYIVLDGYSRSDVLLQAGFDNRKFMDSLKKLGFIIPECGQSNYNKTALSMASTFNMNYLDELGVKDSDLKYPRHQRMLEPYIKNSLVRSLLHNLDYKFITSVSSFFFIDIPDSDLYIKSDFSKDFYSSEIMETVKFQQLFLNTTFARVFIEWLNSNPKNSKSVPLPVIEVLSPMSLNVYTNFLEGTNYSLYQLGRYHLENLEKISHLPDLKFVYTHLLITHRPFTFTASGNFENNDQSSYDSYINSIKFLNAKLLEIIPAIINNSSKPPIIILQSDHSYNNEELATTQNFQAYYFPGMKQDDIDKDFTNVNTFRLIFSRYLGKDMPLLPNKSLQINYLNPSGAQELEKSCPQ